MRSGKSDLRVRERAVMSTDLREVRQGKEKFMLGC
jgi:hypothetical protein